MNEKEVNRLMGRTPYLDQTSIYDSPAKYIGAAWPYIFAFIVALLLVLAYVFFNAAHAAELQDYKGKHLSIFAALCSERTDADALMVHVENGGTPEGVEYMKELDNTCSLTPMDVMVGDTLSEVTDPSKVTWLLVAVTSMNGESHGFMVSMKIIKTNVKEEAI